MYVLYICEKLKETSRTFYLNTSCERMLSHVEQEIKMSDAGIPKLMLVVSKFSLDCVTWRTSKWMWSVKCVKENDFRIAEREEFRVRQGDEGDLHCGQLKLIFVLYAAQYKRRTSVKIRVCRIRRCSCYEDKRWSLF